MNFEQFVEACDSTEYDKVWPKLLVSLWYDKRGNWDAAHSIAQDDPSKMGSAVHAYLHRVEGVLWNADYWYERAGRTRSDVSLEQEWESLARELID